MNLAQHQYLIVANRRCKTHRLGTKLVFEDRKDDTEMWRRNGLLCCQVAEGNY